MMPATLVTVFPVHPYWFALQYPLPVAFSILMELGVFITLAGVRRTSLAQTLGAFAWANLVSTIGGSALLVVFTRSYHDDWVVRWGDYASWLVVCLLSILVESSVVRWFDPWKERKGILPSVAIANTAGYCTLLLALY